jgi:hypothetical protein
MVDCSVIVTIIAVVHFVGCCSQSDLDYLTARTLLVKQTFSAFRIFLGYFKKQTFFDWQHSLH